MMSWATEGADWTRVSAHLLCEWSNGHKYDWVREGIQQSSCPTVAFIVSILHFYITDFRDVHEEACFIHQLFPFFSPSLSRTIIFFSYLSNLFFVSGFGSAYTLTPCHFSPGPAIFHALAHVSVCFPSCNCFCISFSISFDAFASLLALVYFQASFL